jgi:hypothetical protein
MYDPHNLIVELPFSLVPIVVKSECICICDRLMCPGPYLPHRSSLGQPQSVSPAVPSGNSGLYDWSSLGGKLQTGSHNRYLLMWILQGTPACCLWYHSECTLSISLCVYLRVLQKSISRVQSVYCREESMYMHLRSTNVPRALSPTP